MKENSARLSEGGGVEVGARGVGGGGREREERTRRSVKKRTCYRDETVK